MYEESSWLVAQVERRGAHMAKLRMQDGIQMGDAPRVIEEICDKRGSAGLIAVRVITWKGDAGVYWAGDDRVSWEMTPSARRKNDHTIEKLGAVRYVRYERVWGDTTRWNLAGEGFWHRVSMQVGVVS